MPNEVARRVFPDSTVKRFAQEVSVTRVLNRRPASSVLP